MIYRYSLSFILLCVIPIIYAQQPKLEGIVTDSLFNTLEFANVIARPTTKDVSIAFSIADEKGRYKLLLKKNASYKITTSYMGYNPYSFTLDSIAESQTKNIILKPSSQQLDEVIIIHQVPVTVKEDTITYKTKAFVTGEERKLKEVLKKLPGVEVDKNGLVTVQGKKVTKMLVEGKDFFGGGTKLAVENIPADAVETVEVIDDYNKIGFLRGLTDSEEMAMNIKLKKDKKRFVFGDIIGGTGNEKHYLGQANLFYYAPKTNLSYIGNLNDIGYKAFTFKDYMQFQGGISKILKDSKSFFRTSQSNFAEFFESPDYQSNIAKFSALNWRQTIHPKLDFTVYGLFSDNFTKTKEINNNQYQDDNVVFLTENRQNKQRNGKNYGMGKMALKYNPNLKESFEYNLFSKYSRLDFLENTTTNSPLNNNFIKQQKISDNIKIKQDFEWHKKLSKNHTTSLALTHDYNNDQPYIEWLTNEPILQGLLPIIEADEYQINQVKTNETHQLSGLFKHYWIVNNLNHIYTSIGNQYLNQDFSTNDFQRLDDGTINNFNTDDFGNKIHFRLNDFYVGIQYKFKKGKTTLKSGLFEHFYHWKSIQDITNTHNKAILLPKLDIKHEIKKSEKISLKYQLISTFTDATKYVNRFYLLGFNSLMKGNPDLENELAHSASLRYYKFSMYRDIIINSTIRYTNKITSIRNEYQLQGIDQYLIPVMTSSPETNWNFNLNVRKGISDFYIKIKTNLSLSDYQQNINENIINTQSIAQNYGVTLGTTFDKYPNVDIGFDKRISNYTSNTSKSKYTTNEPFAELSYDFLKGFILKADYKKTTFMNDIQTTTTYEFANASLFFQKEDSPFGFEINATNILDVTNKRSSSFSSFLISENQTYVMPRIVVFKLSYKL
jgi:hypothetical protein